jgi:hypothetical protein
MSRNCLFTFSSLTVTLRNRVLTDPNGFAIDRVTQASLARYFATGFQHTSTGHKLGPPNCARSLTPNLETTRNMSDDASYISFLNKANADPKSGQGSTMAQSDSTSQRRSDLDPSSSSEALPPSLQRLPDTTYTSDTDSPFEAVLFSYSEARLPSAKDFKTVLKHAHEGTSEEVEELSVQDFDPRGQYKEIIQRVEHAGNEKGGVKVFRVQTSSTRVEYYILTVGDRMLVGVVAKAVES